MSTVHQFPVQRNQPPAAPEEVADARGVAIDAAVGADASFEAREAAALALTNEATRLFLERELLAIADGHGTHVEGDGVIYQRHEPGIVRYFTLCGAVDIERWTDREMGVRNGPTLVPLDLAAGLVERTTPARGVRIALGDAKDHMRSCAEDMTADHRCPPSRSTLERVATAIGTAATRVAPRIEPRLRRAERVPDGAVAISLGLARTSVPMEEDVPAGETPATRRKTRQTPYTRTKPAPVNVNYRMAYVGTISFHDADGTALATRRYTAAAHESPTDRLVRPMMADLRHALRQVPALAVGVIQDGAPELWNLLRPALLAEPLVTACYEAIDRYHLTERLADVLRYGEPDASTRRARLSRWNESLDGTDHAIYRIRAGVRDRSADALARSDRRLLEQLAPHLTYLENNADLMHDARLRAVGLPVGSGVTEGACKSVIKMRTNGSSQRWRPTGLEAVLTLRSMHMSDRLPRFWANFARGGSHPVRVAPRLIQTLWVCPAAVRRVRVIPSAASPRPGPGTMVGMSLGSVAEPAATVGASRGSPGGTWVGASSETGTRVPPAPSQPGQKPSDRPSSRPQRGQIIGYSSAQMFFDYHRIDAGGQAESTNGSAIWTAVH